MCTCMYVHKGIPDEHSKNETSNVIISEPVVTGNWLVSYLCKSFKAK